jgi:tRNA 2-thiouridine synthesizing protein A
VTPQSQEPVIIDGGDRSCVRLLLELRTRISGLPAGTVIHLIASDPAAPIDLPAWCHLTGHAYLGPIPAATRPTSEHADQLSQVMSLRAVTAAPAQAMTAAHAANTRPPCQGGSSRMPAWLAWVSPSAATPGR